MRRDDQGGPPPPVERTPKPGDGVLVERTRGLIQEEECRLADQSSSESELLNHSGGAAVDTFPCDPADLELLDDRVDRGRGALLPGIAEPGEENEVRITGKSLVERPLLAEGRAEQTLRLNGSGLVLANQDPPAVELERPGDAAEKGRLSRSIGPSQCDPLAGLEGEIDRP